MALGTPRSGPSDDAPAEPVGPGAVSGQSLRGWVSRRAASRGGEEDGPRALRRCPSGDGRGNPLRVLGVRRAAEVARLLDGAPADPPGGRASLRPTFCGVSRKLRRRRAAPGSSCRARLGIPVGAGVRQAAEVARAGRKGASAEPAGDKRRASRAIPPRPGSRGIAGATPVVILHGPALKDRRRAPARITGLQNHSLAKHHPAPGTSEIPAPPLETPAPTHPRKDSP